MIRARRSLFGRNSSSNNNDNWDEEHDGNAMHKGYTQSSAESNTSATNSLTASTTSLLAQQQQHVPLSAAAAAAQKHFHSKPAQRAHYASPFAAENAINFKRPFPGAATRHNPAAAVLSPPHNNNTALMQFVGREVRISSSVRGIRRPRQWLPPPAATDDTAAAAFGTDSPAACAPKANIMAKGKAFIVEFLEGSSIHGFVYLSKIGLNFVERILWFAFICVALFSIISLSKRTWERFQTSPTVISMDRNKLVWNTSFPSLTVCPHKRIDELKVDEYMTLHAEEFQSDEDKEDFRDFIVKLASLSYENIETLPINKTFGIPSAKYLDILYELKWNFEPEISSGAAVQMYIYETLTEFGICHSVNSLVARYNSYDYWKSNDWNLLDHGDRVTVHPLDGEIYAQIINLSTAYDVYFHGAGDVPSISKQRYTFPESDYTTVELIALEIYTAEAARAFSTKQRKCRFQHEADDMLTVPIYSFGLCLAECRMFFALKICGCVPHFYRNRLKTGKVLPVCGFRGLTCLANLKHEIITLKSEKYKIDCNCLSNCDDSNFFVQSHRSRVWFLGANLQWGIIDYPKMQLRRDVLFSFADVLVYIGGLVGFFLGCSALSFTEILYYFTARFIKRIFYN